MVGCRHLHSSHLRMVLLREKQNQIFDDRRLGYLNAECQSPFGMIKSSWRYEADQWVWNFTIPEGSSASVTLPGEVASIEL